MTLPALTNAAYEMHFLAGLLIAGLAGRRWRWPSPRRRQTTCTMACPTCWILFSPSQEGSHISL